MRSFLVILLGLVLMVLPGPSGFRFGSCGAARRYPLGYRHGSRGFLAGSGGSQQD